MNEIPVVVLGTFDTKGPALTELIAALHREDIPVLTVDVGSDRPQQTVDVTRDEVLAAARAAGVDPSSANDRRTTLAVMAAGATEIVGDLVRTGRAGGIIAAGGAGNAELAGTVMQTLPLGLPKVLLTTLASGNTRGLVGGSDIVLMNPIVDVAAPNALLQRAFTDAAAVLSGLLRRKPAEEAAAKNVIFATMFGITTPCVDAFSGLIDDDATEVIAFHATGVGGNAMERIIGQTPPLAVVDITTSEWADEVVGGICSAGPHRLEAAGEAGIPQVVVPGALDAVNFAAPETVPERFRNRTLHRHGTAVTLMRANAEESVVIARQIADRLNAAHGPVTVVLPLGGLSALDAPGQPFWDPDTDRALFDALREHLGPTVTVVESPHHINDPGFAEVLTTELSRLVPQLERKHHVG